MDTQTSDSPRAWNFDGVKCTKGQYEQMELYRGVIDRAGFEVVPLPIRDLTIRWQLQRGDHIYSTFNYSHPSTLVSKSMAVVHLEMLQQFALVASRNHTTPA